MWTTAGRKLDVYDAPELLMEIQKESAELIESLQDMEMLSPEKLAELQDDEFALVVKTAQGRKIRKYPIPDANHVLLAKAYLDKTADQLPQAAQELAEANIQNAVAKLARDPNLQVKVAQNEYRPWEDAEGTFRREEKTAAPTPLYALEKLSEDGRRHCYLPCHTPTKAHQSMRAFETDQSPFQPSERRKIARSFQKAAQAFEIDLSDYPVVQKYLSKNRNRFMKAAFDVRKNLCESDEANGVLDDLYSQRFAFSKEATVRLLEMWDRDQGLDQHWDTPDYPDPHWTVFGNHAKTATDKTATMAQAIADREGLLEEVIGEEKAAMFREAPTETYKSLPKPLRKTLAAAL